jgi:hypothetical protein
MGNNGYQTASPSFSTPNQNSYSNQSGQQHHMTTPQQVNPSADPEQLFKKGNEAYRLGEIDIAEQHY